MALYSPEGGRITKGSYIKAPFDVELLEERYNSGSFTPTRIVSFGAKGEGELMSTGIDIAVTPLAGVEFTDGKQCAEVVACHGTFATHAMGYRGPNLHKSGSTEASDVWIVFPTGAVSPVLVKKLHQGGVDDIVISSLALIDSEDTNKPTAVQAIHYMTCFITYVDMISSPYLTIFSFSFVAVKIVQKCVVQHSSGGKNEVAGGTGNYVWTFDYSAAESKSPRIK
jgi:hypothetical protein